MAVRRWRLLRAGMVQQGVDLMGEIFSPEWMAVYMLCFIAGILLAKR